MNRELRFTPSAEAALRQLEGDADRASLLKQVRKTLGLLETNLRHPSLRTHEFQSLGGPNGEKVFEAYVQNRTPAAWRVFFVYGPDRIEKGRRVPVLTIVALTPHP
ncbi:MAG TPA: hypothetical protein VE129_15500 [Thermoanaerobaculia bacterium]|nr:hypothetical protein [Thermoanaerobaculia bacterium]